MSDIIHIYTISEFHKLNGLSNPEHPLISLVDYGEMYKSQKTFHFIQDFYSIALKRDVVGKFRYGQQRYDFDDGLMTFFAPKQVLQIELTKDDVQKKPSGYILSIHPDFLWNTLLATKINRYDFFGYNVNEALFLSDREEQIILVILEQIRQEYSGNMDDFSKDIIISQIELMLNYSERFYKRQFLTREKSSHEILIRFESVLNQYVASENLLRKGLPTVQYLSSQLNISADYLTSTLTYLTGQSTRQHIQNTIIEKAKEKLSTTSLSISEIAYDLGFEHSQSFSKLFKKRTRQTPMEFRANFN